MGSWSATVMGGDTPYDVHASVMDKLGLTEAQLDAIHPACDKKSVLVCKRLNAKVNELPSIIKEIDSWMGTGGEAYMVLGVIVMCHGATLSDEVRQLAIEGANLQLTDVDSWNDPEERKFYLNDFIEKVTNYNGTPTFLKAEGLFEKMFTKVSQKE